MNGGVSQRISQIMQFLVPVGYGGNSGQLVNEYTFNTPSGLHTSNLLAFGHPKIKDVSTSCLAVEDFSERPYDDNILDTLTYVGVPEAGLAFEEYFEHWSLLDNGSRKPHKLITVSYNELPDYISREAGRLRPSSLLSAKRHQPSFFDLDRSLDQFARHFTQDTLVKRFRHVYDESGSLFEARLRENNRALNDEDMQKLLRASRKSFDRFSIDVLAVCILRDKLRDEIAFSKLATDDVKEILNAASTYFNAYFYDVDDLIEEFGVWDIIQYQYDEMRRGFTFDSFTNDVLADFYEKTLVEADPSFQRELSIYYTPRHITDQILQRLPIEHLPPNKRTVLDGTCGSGNMLLSAYERLSNLLPANYTLQQRHKYLVDKIWGVDKDPHACKVARLSLLNHSLPAGDSWKIRDGSIFDAEPSDQNWFGDVPNIIVSNPPFGRKTSDGKQYENAAKVIEQYIAWLPENGLLGIVMPSSFLTASRGSLLKARKKLLLEFDIFEVWQLPQGTFRSSDAPTCVILARKQKADEPDVEHEVTRIRRVESYDTSKFWESGVATFEYLYDQRKWQLQPAQQMTCTHLYPIWTQVKSSFDEIVPHMCQMYDGIKPGPLANRTLFRDSKLSEEWRPCLRANERYGNALEPFQIQWEKQVANPDDPNKKPTKYLKYVPPFEGIEAPRTPSHFEIERKIVINAAKQANNPWRIYAAIDEDKLLVTEAFNYVLPNDNVSAELLVAVLNSMFANAWYASHDYQRNVTLEILRKMPIPSFDEVQLIQIQSLVSAIQKLKSELPRDNVQIRKKLVELDGAIFHAYGISSQQQQEIQQWMTYHHNRPGQEWSDFTSNVATPTQPVSDYPKWQPVWRFVAEVEAINVESRRISLWVEDVDTVIEIDIPSNLPGWALRGGAAMRISIPKEQSYPQDYNSLDFLKFEALDFGYMTKDEILDVIEGKTELAYE